MIVEAFQLYHCRISGIAVLKIYFYCFDKDINSKSLTISILINVIYHANINNVVHTFLTVGIYTKFLEKQNSSNFFFVCLLSVHSKTSLSYHEQMFLTHYFSVFPIYIR